MRADTVTAVLRLERLSINRYRRIAPGTALVFSPRHNVLLGRNATGKTTLLDLIARVVSFDFSALREEPFDLELVVQASDVGSTVGQRIEMSIANTVSVRNGHVRSEARAEIRLPVGATIRVEPGRSTITWPGLEARAIEPVQLFRPQFLLGLWDEASRVEVPGSVYTDVTPRFEEGVESFEAMTRRTMVRVVDDQVALPGWPSLPFFPSDSIAGLARGERPDSLEVVHPLLAELAEVMGYEQLRLTFSRGAQDMDRAVTYGDIKFHATRRDGSIDTSAQLSYGERRLIALWWYLESNRDVAVIDEVVNGLHHGWIEATMRRLGDRQSFLTCQNPLLVDYLGFESDDEVRQTFVLCSGADAGGLRIRNMQDDEAARFHAAHAVGIQHVSEILRDQGLW